MSSICNINKNPSTWYTLESELHLKPEYGGEEIILIRYGVLDDYPEGGYPMETYIRKSVYNKLLSREYHVVADTTNGRLVVVDSNNDVVPPIDADWCY